jgi:hypothetical protein
MPQQERRECRSRSAPIGLAKHGAQRGAADPVPATFVAERVTPSADARCLVGAVPAVRDRSGSRNDHDAGCAGRARFERHHRIVDDERARFVADPPQQRTHDRRVVGPIHTRDAEADRSRDDFSIADRILHDIVKHFLDVELSGCLEIRARRARFRHERAAFVGEVADRLGSASINTYDVKHVGGRTRLSSLK